MYEGEGQAGGAPPTAFREAEKRYQLHKDPKIKTRRGRAREVCHVARPTDFSAVVDVDAPRGGACVPVDAATAASTAIAGLRTLPYAFPAHPGFFLLRGALAPEQQRRLVTEAFTVYAEPPNHTNFTRAHPSGLPGLWKAAQQGLRLATDADGSGTAGGGGTAGGSGAPAVAGGPAGEEGLWLADGRGPPAASLRRRLRWATLGPPFDWAQRLYRRDVPYTPLPAWLSDLARALAAAVLPPSRPQQDLQPPRGACLPPPFDPDVGLVNFYYEGDTLGGHRDDAEGPDWQSQPLVSLSVGCEAVFLVGSDTKDVPPMAVWLRSGDAVVLSGPARRAYHGVPRVLPGPAPPPALAVAADDPFAAFAAHMTGCRLNLSIRASGWKSR